MVEENLMTFFFVLIMMKQFENYIKGHKVKLSYLVLKKMNENNTGISTRMYQNDLGLHVQGNLNSTCLCKVLCGYFQTFRKAF